MGKFYKNKEKDSAHRAMVLESSRRLADGISEIVRLSDNTDFKDSVSQFFPHSNTNELKTVLCEKAVELGEKAFNLPAEESSKPAPSTTSDTPSTHTDTPSNHSDTPTHPTPPVVDDFDDIVETAHPATPHHPAPGTPHHPAPGTPHQSKRRRIAEVQVERFLSKQSDTSSQCDNNDAASSSQVSERNAEEDSILYPRIEIKGSSDFDDLGSDEYTVLYQNEKMGPVEDVTPTKGFADKESFKVAGIHIYSQEKDDFDLLEDV